MSTAAIVRHFLLEHPMKVRNIKHTLRVIRRRVRKTGTPKFRQVRI
jgi:hypothetical protein